MNLTKTQTGNKVVYVGAVQDGVPHSIRVEFKKTAGSTLEYSVFVTRIGGANLEGFPTWQEYCALIDAGNVLLP